LLQSPIQNVVSALSSSSDKLLGVEQAAS